MKQNSIQEIIVESFFESIFTTVDTYLLHQGFSLEKPLPQLWRYAVLRT